MKILLITPGIEKYLLERGQKPKEVRLFRFSMLSVLAVAACTPAPHEVRIVDEHIEAVDFDADADVVGISFMTAHAPRAYQLGDEFRRRGRTVVFGGMHPTFMTAEALEHCDAVVRGEAERCWPEVLQDITRQRLRRIYHSRQPVDLGTLQPVPRQLLRKGGYVTVNAVQVTRGCPNACRYCSVRQFYGRRQRFRPLDRVIEELRSIPGFFVLFIDDNITGDVEYAKALFRAMAPLRKKWVAQASLSIAEDDELVRLAADSGCCGLFVGLESLNARSLQEVGKGFNRAERYAQCIRRLHDAGIGIEAGLMFGFDADEVSVFERTLDFLLEHGIDAIQVSTLTPLPGTPLYRSMEGDERIIDRRWEHYDYRHVVFRPRRMSPEQLQNGVDWLIGEFYSTRHILRRVVAGLLQPNPLRVLLLTLPVNLGYRRDALRWRIRGRVPA